VEEGRARVNCCMLASKFCMRLGLVAVCNILCCILAGARHFPFLWSMPVNFPLLVAFAPCADMENASSGPTNVSRHCYVPALQTAQGKTGKKVFPKLAKKFPILVRLCCSFCTQYDVICRQYDVTVKDFQRDLMMGEGGVVDPGDCDASNSVAISSQKQ